MTLASRIASAGFFLVTASCNPTTFNGDAHFPGGPAGCAKACQKQGLSMGAFVYAGEYSSACVCSARPASASAEADDGLAAVAIGATGVMTQMRAAEQQAARQPVRR